ncbi:hypothetical protein C2S53_010182 [Perilla frutescens var. hirtella]|uniref:ditrans,polycis-polyprenyl diphosphate synthase [(2E,6E)-farnesyldiphosphate specific] n=1 Tax=Perilla frutescens var. hirtella TaxID=608512 RepID=A0AAD4JB93_PERFH|nr:hypothetical protein C2S53_010182 [Perilla frutescens var. hirtella]
MNLVFKLSQLVLDLVNEIDNFLISSGLLKRYKAVVISKVRCLAVVVDSEKTLQSRKVLHLLRWLASIGLRNVCLYDAEGLVAGLLKGSKEALILLFKSEKLYETTTSGQPLGDQKYMNLEVISFSDGKHAVGKAANFLFKSHYLTTKTEEKLNLTESDMADALGEIDVHCFKIVCNCTTAYQAWNILQIHCEGSISVRQTKLRLLTSKFETLRMLEDETISMYTERLCEVSNESTALGCPISNENMVSKLLRTFPERFNMKISAIEEAHNVSNMSLSEAMSILLTFEMNLENQKSNNPSKEIILQYVTSSSDVQLDVENIQEINEDESLSVALLTKKFNSLVWSMKKGSPNFKPRRLFDSLSSISSGSSKSLKTSDDPVKDIDSVQCRRCSGFGHYANKCPTVHRKQRRNYSAAVLSDESEDEESGKQTVLFVKVNDDFDEMIEALTDMDEVDFDYNISLDNGASDVPSNVMDDVPQEIDNIASNTTNWYEMTLLDEFRNIAKVSQVEEDPSNISHQEALRQLHKVVDEVSDIELNKLRKEVDEASKTFQQLNKGTSTLNEVLTLGITSRAGPGYTCRSSMSISNHNPIKFVKGESSKDVPVNVDSNIKKDVNDKSKEKKYIYHYCQEPGHIKPYYFKYHDDIATGKVAMENSSKSFKKKKSSKKAKISCNVVYTSLKANITGTWYFDSGCSCHMTDNPKFLHNYSTSSKCKVSYGGGAQAINLNDVEVNVSQKEEGPGKSPASTYTSDSEDDQLVTEEGERRRDPPSRIKKNYLESQIIGDQSEGVQTRKKNSIDYKEMVKLRKGPNSCGCASPAAARKGPQRSRPRRRVGVHRRARHLVIPAGAHPCADARGAPSSLRISFSLLSSVHFHSIFTPISQLEK